MADPKFTQDRLAKAIDQFQKAAASKPYLEEQLKTAEGLISQSEAEILAAAQSLGYDPASGMSVEDFVEAAVKQISDQLDQIEAAVA